MTTKTINKLNIYKFILRILKYPLFHNIFFSLIFIISFNFWYSILLLLTSKIKDTNIFYLMFKTSIFFGILYLIILYLLSKHNKLTYSNYNISYLNLDKKFIKLSNIYT